MQRRQTEDQFESQSAVLPQQFESQNLERPEKKRQSAIVAELRDLVGDGYPASDEDLMTLYRGSVTHCCMSMRQCAAA